MLKRKNKILLASTLGLTSLGAATTFVLVSCNDGTNNTKKDNVINKIEAQDIYDILREPLIGDELPSDPESLKLLLNGSDVINSVTKRIETTVGQKDCVENIEYNPVSETSKDYSVSITFSQDSNLSMNENNFFSAVPNITKLSIQTSKDVSFGTPIDINDSEEIVEIISNYVQNNNFVQTMNETNSVTNLVNHINQVIFNDSTAGLVSASFKLADNSDDQVNTTLTFNNNIEYVDDNSLLQITKLNSANTNTVDLVNSLKFSPGIVIDEASEIYSATESYIERQGKNFLDELNKNIATLKTNICAILNIDESKVLDIKLVDKYDNGSLYFEIKFDSPIYTTDESLVVYGANGEENILSNAYPLNYKSGILINNSEPIYSAIETYIKQYNTIEALNENAATLATFINHNADVDFGTNNEIAKIVFSATNTPCEINVAIEFNNVVRLGGNKSPFKVSGEGKGSIITTKKPLAFNEATRILNQSMLQTMLQSYVGKYHYLDELNNIENQKNNLGSLINVIKLNKGEIVGIRFENISNIENKVNATFTFTKDVVIDPNGNQPNIFAVSNTNSKVVTSLIPFNFDAGLVFTTQQLSGVDAIIKEYIKNKHSINELRKSTNINDLKSQVISALNNDLQARTTIDEKNIASISFNESSSNIDNIYCLINFNKVVAVSKTESSPTDMVLDNQTIRLNNLTYQAAIKITNVDQYFNVINNYLSSKHFLSEMNDATSKNALINSLKTNSNITMNDGNILSVDFTLDSFDNVNIAIKFDKQVNISGTNNKFNIEQIMDNSGNYLVTNKTPISFNQGITITLNSNFDYALNKYISNFHTIDDLNSSSNNSSIISQLSQSLNLTNGAQITALTFSQTEENVSNKVNVKIQFNKTIELSDDQGNFQIVDSSTALQNKTPLDALLEHTIQPSDLSYSEENLYNALKSLNTTDNIQQTINENLYNTVSIINFLNFYPNVINLNNKKVISAEASPNNNNNIQFKLIFDNYGTVTFSGQFPFKYFIIDSSTKTLVSLTDSARNATKLNLLYEDVEHIGDQAIKGNKASQFVWPRNIKTIGFEAFRDSKVTITKIPDSVTEIGEGAFWGCHNLNSIEFTNSMNYIPASCFSWCNNLESIVFPDNLTVIKESAFKGSGKVWSLNYPNNLPDTLTTIERFAFQNCNWLEGANMRFSPNSQLVAIGVNAFNGPNKTIDLNNCSRIDQEIFNNIQATNPNAVFIKSDYGTSFNDGTFNLNDQANANYNESSKTLSIPSGTKIITGRIPENIRSVITTIDFTACKDTLLKINDNAFWDCTALTTINTGNTASEGSEKVSNFPESLRSIGNNTFRRTKITSFIAPKNLIYIGNRAFADCYSVRELDLLHSERVSVIEGYAFAGAGINGVIRAPGTIQGFNDNTFMGNQSITGVEFLEGFRYVSEWTFQQTRIRSIKIPSSMTTIGNAAFANTQVPEVIFSYDNPSLKELGQWAFFNSEFRNTKIPSSVRIISNEAFVYNQNNQISFDVNSELSWAGNKSFGNYRNVNVDLTNCTFLSCKQFNDIKKNNPLPKISANYFLDLSTITLDNFENGSLRIQPQYKFIGGQLTDRIKSSLIRLYIPETVQSIDRDTFANNHQLSVVSFDVNSKFDYIGIGAFRNCTSLKQIRFPASLRQIDKEAFVGSGLIQVTITGKIETFGPDIFFRGDTVPRPSRLSVIFENWSSLDRFLASWNGGVKSDTIFTVVQLPNNQFECVLNPPSTTFNK